MPNYRVPFIRGATPDRDFVHWRMAPYSILAGDAALQKYFPVGFTLDQMLRLSWRIRKLKFNCTYTYNFTIYNSFGEHQDGVMTIGIVDLLCPVQKYSPIFIPGGGGAPVQGHEDATAENQLMDFPNPKLRRFKNPGGTGYVEVLPITWGPLDSFTLGEVMFPVGGNFGFFKFIRTLDTPTFATKSVSGTGISLSSQVFPHLSNISFSNSLLGYQPPPNDHGLPQEQVFFNPITKLFYPYFVWTIDTDIYIDFTTVSGTEGPDRQRSTISTHPGGGSPPTVGALHLLGHDVPLYLTANPTATGTSPVPQPTGHAIDVTVVPDKYWKFKNTAGEDVYDEATGVPIADIYS